MSPRASQQVEDLDERFHPESLGVVRVGPPLDDAVRVEEQLAAGAQLHLERRPARLGHDPTRGPWAPTPTGPLGGAQPHRRWVAGQDQRARAPVPVDDQEREAGEREALALGAEEPSSTPRMATWSRPARARARQALRRRAANAAASGPWPTTSPTSTAHVPSSCLDRVVEVAAQLGPPAARLVPHEHADVGGPDGRGGGEGTLEASVLGPLPLGPNELAAELCRPVPLDRVAHRPGQQLLVDPALDQVVLRAGASASTPSPSLAPPVSTTIAVSGASRPGASRPTCPRRRAGPCPAARSRRHGLPTGGREVGDPLDGPPAALASSSRTRRWLSSSSSTRSGATRGRGRDVDELPRAGSSSVTAASGRFADAK